MDSKTTKASFTSLMLTIVGLFFIVSCSVGVRLSSDSDDLIIQDNVLDVVDLNEISIQERTWIIPDGPRKQLRERNWDLQHQKIWVSFDFDGKQVHGVTELFLTNQIENNSEIILDSKTTQIHSIRRVGDQRLIPFVKDSALIRIPLDYRYSKGDSVFIRLEYVATPPNRGLYFVGPDFKSPDKPVQVWTLGQPEDNSFWLPTIDHPAERTTTEQWIRVPENFTTVSNGRLIRSAVEQGDSLRTDYWVMDKPHAPYLIALAAGEYTQANQLHNDIVLSYLAEPKFAPYLYSMYKDTDTMLSYFEDKLGVKYPWGTYAQVPVRDFIARGMENTTASFYFEAIQMTDRQQMDISHQDLLAHELIHQWFGNLVTTEDWANLPLNEGFANYFETLFREFKDGLVSSQVKVIEDRNAYFNESYRFRRPVIFDRYSVPEDMYDRHTYEKMGLILRQYHHLIGNQLWWEGLRVYLQDNMWNSVNWKDLSNAFKKVTGEDHNWFWSQWLLEPGHPSLKVSYDFDGDFPVIHFVQIQDTQLQPTYRLNIPIVYHDNYGNVYKNSYQIAGKVSNIVIPMAKDSVSVIDVDPDRILLVEYQEEITDFEWISRLVHSSVIIRSEAVSIIGSKLEDHPNYLQLLQQAFELERVPQVRLQILQSISSHLNSTHLPWVHTINQDSEDYYLVRILAANISVKIAGIKGNIYLESLKGDKSYYVDKHIDNLLGQ